MKIKANSNEGRKLNVSSQTTQNLGRHTLPILLGGLKLNEILFFGPVSLLCHQSAGTLGKISRHFCRWGGGGGGGREGVMKCRLFNDHLHLECK